MTLLLMPDMEFMALCQILNAFDALTEPMIDELLSGRAARASLANGTNIEAKRVIS